MPTGNAAESNLVAAGVTGTRAHTSQQSALPYDALPDPLAVEPAADKAVESSIASRQTVNLRQRDDERLQRLKDFCGGNANDAIRLSLGVADIVREVINSGGQLVVQHADGRSEALKLVI